MGLLLPESSPDVIDRRATTLKFHLSTSTTKRQVAPPHLLKNEQFKITLPEHAYIPVAHIPQKGTTSFHI